MNVFGRFLGRVATLLAWSALSGEIEITEFKDGYLTFYTENTNLLYHVEYKANLTDAGDWDGTYDRLKNIQPTNSVTTVPVGKFFRVLGTPDPVGLGTALVDDILEGKTIFADGEELTGTMPNIGQQNLTPGTTAQTISLGYHDGTGEVTGDADLLAGNIRKDVTLFNVAGYYVDTALPMSGRTNSVVTGDDGDLQHGVAWPDPRFTDHGDGTVTDNITGLMWVKAPHDLPGNANTWSWVDAIDFCNNLAYAGVTDWRLPNVRELASLIDYGRFNPPLPYGHPFTINASQYWSSTLRADSHSAGDHARAWRINFVSGYIYEQQLLETYFYAWPVRAGR